MAENLPRLYLRSYRYRHGLLHASVDPIENGVLNLTVKQAEEKQRTLETSFSQMFSYYGDKNDSPVTEYSLAVYCFSQFADNTSVFIMDGETVYSNINLPKPYYRSQVMSSKPILAKQTDAIS